MRQGLLEAAAKVAKKAAKKLGGGAAAGGKALARAKRDLAGRPLVDQAAEDDRRQYARRFPVRAAGAGRLPPVDERRHYGRRFPARMTEDPIGAAEPRPSSAALALKGANKVGGALKKAAKKGKKAGKAARKGGARTIGTDARARVELPDADPRLPILPAMPAPGRGRVPPIGMPSGDQARHYGRRFPERVAAAAGLPDQARHYGRRFPERVGAAAPLQRVLSSPRVQTIASESFIGAPLVQREAENIARREAQVAASSDPLASVYRSVPGLRVNPLSPSSRSDPWKPALPVPYQDVGRVDVAPFGRVWSDPRLRW